MNKAKRLSCTVTSVLILLIFVTGCGRPLEDGKDGQSLVLQSYIVPAEYASEVSSIINSLLTKVEGGQQVKIGQARVGPGNIVLVTAPGSIQSGIEKMILELKQSKPEPPPMVSITYWIVRGRPAKETTWSSNLKEIESALSAVASSDEPMSFSLQERLNLFETCERNLAVRRAVDALPERLRRIVLLSEFTEMTYEQIGHVLGIPAGTVGYPDVAPL
jgi:hypothetical protein